MKNSFLVCIFFLASHLSHAQWPSNNFISYPSANSGTTLDVCNAIVQEPNGIIWIGTADGLFRFDGFRYEKFSSNLNDSTTISDNLIANLYYEDGLLYIATALKGVSVLNTHTGKAQRLALLGKERALRYTAHSITAYNKDSLLISTRQEMLLKMHKKNFGITPIKLSPNPGADSLHNQDAFSFIKPDSFNNNLWWLCSGNGLYLANLKTGKYQQFKLLDNNQASIEGFTKIIEENDSIIWVAAFNTGLHRLNHKRNTFQSFFYQNPASGDRNNRFIDLEILNDSIFALANTTNQLLLFNKKITAFFSLNHDKSKNNSLPKGIIRKLHKTKNGGLVLPITKFGLAYYPQVLQTQQAFQLPFTQTEDNVFGTVALEINDSLILIGKSAENLYLYNTLSNKWHPITYSLPKEVAKPWPFYIKPSSSKTEWVINAPNSSVFILNILKKNITPYYGHLHNVKQENDIYITDFIDNDTISIYSADDGLYYFDKRRKESAKYIPDDFPAKPPYPLFVLIAPDYDGKFWLASFTKLYIFNPKEKRIYPIPTQKDNLRNGLVRIVSIKPAKNGWLYVATFGNGLYILNAKKNGELVAHIEKINGKKLEALQGLTLDEDSDMIWLTTNTEIIAWDKENNRSYVSDKHNSLFEYINERSTATMPKHKEAFIVDSLLYKIPFTINPPLTLNPIINAVRSTNYLLYNPEKKIPLPKETKNITVFVNSDFLSEKEHQKIYYKIDKKEEWLLSNNGEIQLSNLNHGKSILYIKMENNGLIAGYGETQYTIYRELYFYQTLWFKIGMGLLIAAFAYFLFKRRIKNIRRKIEEENELSLKLTMLETMALKSQMNPHFLFNTLNTLRYLVMISENKKAAEYTFKLSRLLRMIMNHAAMEKISLQEEIEALELYIEIEKLRFEDHFSYTITVNEEVEPYSVKIPPLIIQPFVENALKHGLANCNRPNRELRVNVNLAVDNNVIINITDNGIGRKKSGQLKQSTSFGSKGTTITMQRIDVFNKTNKEKINISITDLSQDDEYPGTNVSIYYKD